MAVRVVQQIDQHTAQVLGVEQHAHWVRRQFHVQPAAAPMGNCTVRAQSAAASATVAAASMARTNGMAPGATSITSSTMRLSRSTLSATMCARRAVALAIRLPASARWPARWQPAGCGSRGQCRPTHGPSRPAFPAGFAPAACAGLPAAARQRFRPRCFLHASRPRPRMKRTRMRRVRVWPPANSSITSRPASGQVAVRQRLPARRPAAGRRRPATATGKAPAGTGPG
jgi:hypothetical protein